MNVLRGTAQSRAPLPADSRGPSHTAPSRFLRGIGRHNAAMRLRVLGCSGGIGGQHNRTTSFLVDQDILIDAGTGVGDLSLAELKLIDHIFVTHSHLDHVNSIAFFLDSVGRAAAEGGHGVRDGPHDRDPEKAPVQLGHLAGFHRDPHARTAVVALPGGRGGGGDRPSGDARSRCCPRSTRFPPSATCSTAERGAWSSPATPGRTTRCGAW